MNRKRIFDLTLAIFGLVFVWPILIFIALLILFFDGRPVMFNQERIGRKGRAFYIYKFRTMTPAKDADRPGLTIGDDPRITRIGSYLRRYKLDELPQIFNVLRGEMSFVGPRPEVPQYVRMYRGKQLDVLELIPGITDPASLKYKCESELLDLAEDPETFYLHRIMPDKIQLNLDYAARATCWSDFTLMMKTIVQIFVHRER